ncbi:hypothetical protein C8R44DRAFT_729702 [Mycena epipterygia]|nr:hypothetical protein C8R44DRAFT_729702 [Mycena epipterygia]
MNVFRSNLVVEPTSSAVHQVRLEASSWCEKLSYGRRPCRSIGWSGHHHSQADTDVGAGRGKYPSLFLVSLEGLRKNSKLAVADKIKTRGKGHGPRDTDTVRVDNGVFGCGRRGATLGYVLACIEVWGESFGGRGGWEGSALVGGQKGGKAADARDEGGLRGPEHSDGASPASGAKACEEE